MKSRGLYFKLPPLWGGLAAFLPVLGGVYLVNPENQLMKVNNKVKTPQDLHQQPF